MAEEHPFKGKIGKRIHSRIQTKELLLFATLPRAEAMAWSTTRMDARGSDDDTAEAMSRYGPENKNRNAASMRV